MEEIKFGGIWTIPQKDESFNGELLINEQEGIINLVVYNTDKKDFWGHISFAEFIPLINGTLTNGAKIALIDCKVVHRSTKNFSFNTIIIHAAYALEGINFTSINDVRFNKINYILSNIIKWSDLCKYKKLFDEFDEKECIIWERKEPVNFIINSEKEVTVYPFRGREETEYYSREVNLYQNVAIEFSYKTPLSLSKSIKDIDSIINLVSLAINKNVWIKKMKYFHEQNSFNLENEKIIEPLRVYINRSQGDENELSNYDILFYLTQLCENEMGYLSNWFAKYEDLKPVVELYASLFKYPEMPLFMHFLNNVQALETYHSRFICKELEDYKTRVEKILKKCPEDIKEQHRKELINSERVGADYIILKDRLNDLMLNEFNFAFFNMSSDPFPYNFVNKVVDTRHYFTHWEKSKEEKALKGEDLKIALAILRIVIDYYLLKEIGFSQEYIERVVNKRQSKIISYYEVP